MEQPHDEIHLAIGGQDHQPIKAEVTKTYDKFGNLAKSTKGMSAQVTMEFAGSFEGSFAGSFAGSLRAICGNSWCRHGQRLGCSERCGVKAVIYAARALLCRSVDIAPRRKHRYPAAVVSLSPGSFNRCLLSVSLPSLDALAALVALAARA